MWLVTELAHSTFEGLVSNWMDLDLYSENWGATGRPKQGNDLVSLSHPHTHTAC